MGLTFQTIGSWENTQKAGEGSLFLTSQKGFQDSSGPSQASLAQTFWKRHERLRVLIYKSNYVHWNQ